jgi:hypothetical protein
VSHTGPSSPGAKAAAVLTAEVPGSAVTLRRSERQAVKVPCIGKNPIIGITEHTGFDLGAVS